MLSAGTKGAISQRFPGDDTKGMCLQTDFPPTLGTSSPRRRRLKVVDQVIESLRQDIVTRRLADGARLPSEKDLSSRFQVSQPTVREAIRALEALGLIDVLHGNGSFVRSQGDYGLASALQTLLQLESVGVMEVLDVRQVLGRRSIELAAKNATDRDIEVINLACSRFDQLQKLEESEIIAQILFFQRAVSAASHSPLLHSLEQFLLSLLNEVQVKSFRERGKQFWHARALNFQVHRIEILHGIRSRDPQIARRAMNRYFEAQRARFEQDKDLRALDLSNAGLVSVMANMVQEYRASSYGP